MYPFDAAFNGDLQHFKDLLYDPRMKEGMAKNYLIRMVDFDGLTALHYAAMGGRTEICKFLVEEVKLNVDLKDLRNGRTPLHHAVLTGRIPTAAYLLDNGANPNAGTKHKGRTALHYAADKGPKELIELLLSKGADIDAMADCGTPLQYAAARRKKDSVKLLLDNHADPNVVSHNLSSPLLASIHALPVEYAPSFECMKLLLKAGADPNFRGLRGTPLGFAASEGETEVVRYLLNAGANPNVVDNLGMKPVEVAALRGNRKGVMTLFPVTSPIPTISDWSVDGLFEYVHSDEATKERKEKKKEQFLFSKSKGTEAYNIKDYFGAMQWYTEAINFEPTDASAWSNRSLCWAHMDDGDSALLDAEECIELKPNWPKGYYRAGAAEMLLEDFVDAADCFYRGWKLDRKNKELERAFREAIKAQKKKLLSIPDI
ncbi:hypothetical protein SLA2020_163880 [Shorea laevis]